MFLFFYIPNKSPYHHILSLVRSLPFQQIRGQFCSNSDNCAFSQTTGFSTRDRDVDTWSSNCQSHYGGFGWWYARGIEDAPTLVSPLNSRSLMGVRRPP